MTKSYDELLGWLSERVEYFHENGCRLSDQGNELTPYVEGNAAKFFNAKMSGEVVDAQDEEIYKTAVMTHCAKEYAKHGWTMQLHMGALRNNNTRRFERLGPDIGFDSIHDLCIAKKLSQFMDSLEMQDCLPKQFCTL